MFELHFAVPGIRAVLNTLNTRWVRFRDSYFV